MKVFRTRVSEGMVKRQTFLSDALRLLVQCSLPCFDTDVRYHHLKLVVSFVGHVVICAEM